LKHIWWEVGKCHMGWWLGCRIFCGQFNQDVMWETNPWHVWPKHYEKIMSIAIRHLVVI
jgi:hypothetical protein